MDSILEDMSAKRKAEEESLFERYKKYVQEWEYLVRCNRNGFVPWSISNNYGDPFNMKEWKEREYLHNFKGTNY